MLKTSLRQKTFLLFFSLVTTLLLLEIGLRITGNIFLWKKERENQLNFSRQNSYRILCLGESTTFLGGEDSYPSQLERILNTTLTNKTVKVINKGIPGANSNQILAHAGKWLDEYHPDLVLIMMGINDSPTLIPRQRLSPTQRLVVFLQNLRVNKLYRWIHQAGQQKLSPHSRITPIATTTTQNKTPDDNGGRDAQKQAFENASPLLKEGLTMAVLFEANGEFPKGESVYRKMLTLTDDQVIRQWIYLRLERNLQQQQKYDDILDILEFIPHHSWVEDWVERFCTDPIKAQRMHSLLDKKIEEEPTTLLFQNYKSACYARFGDTTNAERYAREAENQRKKHINPTTKGNYLELLRSINQHESKPIIVQYAMLDPNEIREMLAGDEELQKILVIDNREAFTKALSTASYDEIFTDRFAGTFGHCTNHGNLVLAENIADFLMKNIFQQSPAH